MSIDKIPLIIDILKLFEEGERHGGAQCRKFERIRSRMSGIRLVRVNHQPSRVRIGGLCRGFPFDLGAQYKSLTFNGTRALRTGEGLNG